MFFGGVGWVTGEGVVGRKGGHGDEGDHIANMFT